MKRKLFVAILFAFCVSSIYLQKIPNSPKKINGKGEYQKYFGYSIVAMIGSKQHQTAVQMESFLRKSRLARTYSPLPANTYHMSIFTIYSCGKKMIAPVAKWFKDHHLQMTNQNCLHDGLLIDQHNRATCVLRKYFKQPMRIKKATLKIGKSIISLSVELQEESLRRLRSARKELKQIYQHPNESMEPIDRKLHITLAYNYRHQTSIDKQEKRRLLNLAKQFNGAELSMPHVYRYTSMKQYTPFLNVKCF